MDLAALLQPKLPLEYNDILRTVGEQEGFKNFLLGDESSSSPRLAKHASPGPIVNLNQTKYRADALITTFKGVISIPLPDFTYDKCIEHEALVLDARRVMATEPDRASTQMNTVLTWLWVAVAEPVLEKLNITGSLDAHQKLPRIWWLSNKWTAGDYARALRTGEACTVMDRAISSYVPSIRALDFLRTSAANLSSTKNHLAVSEAVLVKMPTTPDDTDLPNVENEVARVEGWLKPSFQVVSLTRPRRKDVLSLLETASVAHFACHGVANADDPFLSTLELQDWKNHPLDVRTLLDVSFKRLEFVYLSFCEITTTTTTAAAAGASGRLQDECIHLPGAFQMTGGVPYMVASIWKIEDNTISAEVSGDVYAFLKEGDFDFGRSAEALHAAILKARNKGADALYWAALVHFGV